MKNKAFTLIEIMVVIAIIATLSALIYASFNSTRSRSRDQKRVSDVHEIQLVLEQYFNRNHFYPIQLQDLVTAKFIASIPTPPSIEPAYHYFPIAQTPTNQPGSQYCTSYHLWTTLEASSSYLFSKRGFSSAPLPTGLYLCTGGNSAEGIDASSNANPFVYDVTP